MFVFGVEGWGVVTIALRKLLVRTAFCFILYVMSG